ncbi:MAG: hypothetical protein R3Y23_01880 [Bacillota bacterium]
MKKDKKYKMKETYYRVLMSTVVDANKVNKCDKFEFMCSAIKVLSSSYAYIDLVSVQYEKRVLSHDPRAITIDIDIKLAAHAKYSETDIMAVFNSINREAFGAECLMPCAVKVKKGRKKITACNSTIARAYTVALKGAKGRLAFPNIEAKKYFVALINSACKTMPFRVLAHSITHNGAYLTVCNFDKHKKSVSMMIKTLADSYLSYYNKQNGTNLVEIFTRRSLVASVVPEQIFNSIARVNAQPYLAGVPQMEAQQFSSSDIVGNESVLNLIAMYINTNLSSSGKKCAFIGASKVQEHLVSAQNNPLNNVQIKGRFEQEKPKYSSHFESSMYNFGLLSTDNMSRVDFALVALDMREIYGYDINEILLRSLKTDEAKYDVLTEMVYIQMIDKRLSARATRRSLGDVVLDNGILVSAIVLVNERKGYGYKYIVESIGLSSENMVLENEVIDEVCNKYMLTPISAKIKLNIA